MYNSLLAKFTSRPIDTGLLNSPVHTGNAVKAANYSPITITKRTNADMSSESTLIRALFTLKGVADNTAISKAVADDRLDYVTDNSLLTILSDNHSVANKTVGGRSIFYLESNLLLKDYPTKFNKISANENTIKQLNLDHDLSSILESSTANALSRANANRWLLRMLPISDSLNINNSLFTSLKSKVGNPSQKSNATTNNIWLSSHNVPGLSDFADFSINQPSNGNAIIDNFEVSRLWNQKRNYLTLVPSLYLTDQVTNLSQNNSGAKSYSSAYTYALNAANLDYSTLKATMVNAPDSNLGQDSAVLATPAVFMATTNLNFWNSTDKFFVISLCSSDAKSAAGSYYFDLLSYSTDYKL